MTRILVEALGWSDAPSGLTTYCYSIIRELSTSEDGLYYTVLHNVSSFQESYGSEFKNSKIEFIYVNLPLLSLRKEIHFFLNKKKYEKYDVFYSMSSYFPVFKPAISSVATVHDLKYVNFPYLIGKWKSLIISFLIRNSVESANKIIAISRFTKDEIEKKYHKFRDVKVIYEGPSRFCTGSKSNNSICLESENISKLFFLSVAENRPHKNLERLLRAFRLVLSQNGSHDVQLVLVGSGVSRLSGLCRKLEIDKQVLLAGSVSDDDLRSLFVKAICLVFPSFYEGFGIPLVDAMYCGTPIITSDMTATREIAHGVGLLIDPKSDSQIANAMLKMLKSKNTKIKLSKAGCDAKLKYNWKTCANEVVNQLKQVAELKA